LRIAYIIPNPAPWIMTEIKALMRKGVIPLICIYDWTQEKKMEGDFPIVSANFWDYVSANILFLFKHRLEYLRLARATKSKMGLRLFFRMIFFAQVLRKSKIDHIHAHFAASAAYMAKAIAELIGCSFSFTAHAYDIFKDDVDQDELCNKMLSAAFVRTVSQYHKKYLEGICPRIEPSKIRSITYGVDCSEFRPMGVEKSDKLILLTACNLVPKKGLSYLIEACHRLRRKDVDFTCYVVGEGPLQSEIDRQINEMGLSGTVQMVGRVSHGELNSWLGRCHAFVLPCVVTEDDDRDGIPNVLIEAMAAGVPVISTDVAGIPELIEDKKTGLLVPQRDGDTLADAITTLALNDPLRLELAYRGKEKVKADFNIEKIADQLIELFRDSCLRNRHLC